MSDLAIKRTALQGLLLFFVDYVVMLGPSSTFLTNPPEHSSNRKVTGSKGQRLLLASAQAFCSSAPFPPLTYPQLSFIPSFSVSLLVSLFYFLPHALLDNL